MYALLASKTLMIPNRRLHLFRTVRLVVRMGRQWIVRAWRNETSIADRFEFALGSVKLVAVVAGWIGKALIR